MKQGSSSKENSAVVAEGARRATGDATASGVVLEPLAPGQRWSLTRKREVVLRILRGESMEALSRELGVELRRLARWRDRALSGMDEALRERKGDPLRGELDAAILRVGELSMENELLRKARVAGPLGSGRSRR